MIFTAPKLTARELAVVAKTDEVKASLGYAIETPSRWTGVLRRNTLGRAIRGSNSIEGYNVTVEDAMAAAEGEELVDAATETRMAVEGYRNAMTYVLQLARDPHFHFSTDLLRSLHYMMLSYDLTKNPGRWRPGPIYVHDESRGQQVYEGLDAEHVPVLMGELAQSLEAGDDSPPVVRAAMAHLNLAMIHPYSDGNGRMARCLHTLVLARVGTLAAPFSGIEEYLGANQRPYYDVLAEVGKGSWQPQNDARPWVRFCLRAHYIQASTLLRRSREVARLWDALEKEIAQARLPERTIFAAIDAALGYRIRNAHYRAAAEISDDLASRDLKALVDSGYLIPSGERRGRHYVASPRLTEFRVKTADPDRGIADPFEEAG